MKPMTIDQLNALPPRDAVEAFQACCGTTWWCEQMAACRPFDDVAQVHDAADAIFEQMGEGHWMQAFAAHPKIGDMNSLRMKFAGNKQWSAGEQAGVNEADDAVLHDLSRGNDVYEKRFGYIFIVCASGLSAEQMLSMLQKRLRNDPHTEAAIASDEQTKITHLRLDKMLA